MTGRVDGGDSGPHPGDPWHPDWQPEEAVEDEEFVEEHDVREPTRRGGLFRRRQDPATVLDEADTAAPPDTAAPIPDEPAAATSPSAPDIYEALRGVSDPHPVSVPRPASRPPAERPQEPVSPPQSPAAAPPPVTPPPVETPPAHEPVPPTHDASPPIREAVVPEAAAPPAQAPEAPQAATPPPAGLVAGGATVGADALVDWSPSGPASTDDAIEAPGAPAPPAVPTERSVDEAGVLAAIAERLARERDEEERRVAEEEARQVREKEEAERQAAEDEARQIREAAEAERRAAEEEVRRVREREEADRRAAEETARRDAQAAELEAAAMAAQAAIDEAERRAVDAEEGERRASEESRQRAIAEAERRAARDAAMLVAGAAAREATDRAATERRVAEDEARRVGEAAEAEQRAREAEVEAERRGREAEVEAEERAAEEAARVAEEEAARLAAEQAEVERLATEQADAERRRAREAELRAAETAGVGMIAAVEDAERHAAHEAERLAAEQVEVERLATEQADAERRRAREAELRAAEMAGVGMLASAEAERIEAQHKAAERAETDRLEAERLEAERVAAQRARIERLAREQEQAERRAATWSALGTDPPTDSTGLGPHGDAGIAAEPPALSEPVPGDEPDIAALAFGSDAPTEAARIEAARVEMERWDAEPPPVPEPAAVGEGDDLDVWLDFAEGEETAVEPPPAAPDAVDPPKRRRWWKPWAAAPAAATAGDGILDDEDLGLGDLESMDLEEPGPALAPAEPVSPEIAADDALFGELWVDEEASPRGPAADENAPPLIHEVPLAFDEDEADVPVLDDGAGTGIAAAAELAPEAELAPVAEPEPLLEAVTDDEVDLTPATMAGAAGSGTEPRSFWGRLFGRGTGGQTAGGGGADAPSEVPGLSPERWAAIGTVAGAEPEPEAADEIELEGDLQDLQDVQEDEAVAGEWVAYAGGMAAAAAATSVDVGPSEPPSAAPGGVSMPAEPPVDQGGLDGDASEADAIPPPPPPPPPAEPVPAAAPAADAPPTATEHPATAPETPTERSAEPVPVAAGVPEAPFDLDSGMPLEPVATDAAPAPTGQAGDEFGLDGIDLIVDGISEEHYYLHATTQEHEGLAEAVKEAAEQGAELQALSASMPGLDSGVVGFEDVQEHTPEAEAGDPQEGDDELLALSQGSNLLLRVLTALVLVGLFVGTVWLGRTALTILLVVVIVFALGEFYAALMRSGYRPLSLFGFLGGAGTILAVRVWGTIAIPSGVLLTLVAIFLLYSFGGNRSNPLSNGSATITVMAWIAGLTAFAIPIIESPEFRVLVFSIVALTVFMDIGQYFAGRSWGEHKLAPVISPKKTVEGLLGGAAITILSGAALGYIAWFDPFELTEGLALGITVAALVPLGDLSVSMVKRSLGVKDMGGILPGHGGVMDRIDGLIFVIPGSWLLFQWLGWLI